MPSPKALKKFFENYQHNHRVKQRIAEIYYRKLFKASLLISTVPVIVIAIMVIYERLTPMEGFFGAIAVLFGSTFFAKPYFDDLSSLTTYVELLALNKKAKTPPLSFLGNVEELSQAVKNLHDSWGKRKLELEEAVAESSILFDTIPDVLMMLDANSMIIRANNAAISVLGKNIVGKELQSVIREKEIKNAVEAVLSTGKEYSAEISITIQNNSYHYLVMLEKFPVESSSGIAVVLIMHDITESTRRKQMMKDFVANASHEIRTPLTSVMGFIENLQSMDDSPADKKARKKFLGIMSEQTERMSNLINELLSLSKVEMNESTLPSGNADIAKLLANIKRRLSFLASQKDMDIKIIHNDDVPDIIGDEDELTQVFTNLVSNAIKYGTPKTKVEIICSLTEDFHPSEYMPKDCKKLLLVAVKDYGEGIAEEHIPRLTERFYRVDKVRSRKIGGTGLGLAIAKHILRRHRGDLLIESRLGEGSVFTARLPVVEIANG